MREARPRPIVRLRYETASDRIAVDVAKLLDALGFGVYVEVVIARLPKGALGALNRDGNLERLERFGESGDPRLAQEKVDVLGHNDVSGDEEAVAEADGFERLLKQGACFGGAKVRSSVIAGERNEVEVSRFLITD